MVAGAIIMLASLQGVPGMDLPAGLVPAGPVEYRVLSEESVFAVITDKGGIAAGKAHRHLVIASAYDAVLTFDQTDPSATTFEFTTLAEQLVVDDPEHKERWAARIGELGVTDDLGTVSDNDREKIRKEMLDDDQLDPEQYPEIRVSVSSVREAPEGEVESASPFTHLVDVQVTVHGQTITRSVPASYEFDGAKLSVEALGEFTFKEFGISPYSAFLGAVKVKNEFHMYVRLTAVRA